MPHVSSVRACGLDFGTSNSTVGCVRPGRETLLPLEEDKVTLPSVVFFNADDGRTYFGRAALQEYLSGYDGRLMRSMKSLLGSRLLDGRTEVHGRSLLFRDLLSQFIGELKRRADAQGGRAFEHVVLGRPVYFVDDDPAADRMAETTLAEIARSVGFKEVSFQYEPIAAAFHYETGIGREELVLVVDIGGGTSDFSLVRLSPQRAAQADRREDLLANGGVHIGGTDFDRLFSLASVMPLFGFRSLLKSRREIPSRIYYDLATWHSINAAYTYRVLTEQKRFALDSQAPEKTGRLLTLIEKRAGHWLANEVEQAKIALSDHEYTTLALDRIETGLQQRLTREEFDAATTGLVGKIETKLAELLRDAGVAPERIDTIFFTGGASGVPQLRRRIAAMLPQARPVEGDLFGSIGAGLAIEAARRYG
ncbi:Hsp70 family protein [uncultured Propionivibrio sp.]|uniref:Hsp70 family protein n=1 Tax=uncultured Propionivibrio sp. TaxID=426737 RepID=UPI0029C09E24|nr:Hsp70 family protein [uncultured Propionivibrio sp.]